MSAVLKCADCGEIPVIEKYWAGWSVACECYDPSPVNYDDPPPISHNVTGETRDKAVELWNESWGAQKNNIYPHLFRRPQ